MVGVEERFWSKVVKGPAATDCWLWVGAIGDDGYGRFWTRTVDGAQLVLRPHRFAFELLTGEKLGTSDELLHECDVPLCVHAATDPMMTHLTAGTRTLNMRDRSDKGRHENGHTRLGMRGLSRAALAARSRRLRTVLLEQGWNAGAIRSALSDVDEAQPALFIL
ncbi:hypothetical protein [Agromyces sp. NPDC058126]|uniref:hypothetical protein n=1 Tax=Agromyces sp. NPDC058126 TaxID=3346350 RepID=UPI0036DE2FE2